ncbi:MAG: hypothetical protein ACRD3B_00815 [Candidatus Sulfotelmatobacter sp.]
MNAAAAKQFLISRVIEEAESEHVSLSEVEKKMLYFTEVHPRLPDILEVHAEFERDYDADEYEDKIAQLLKKARPRDSQVSPSREQDWKDALDALRKEDHYILVMVNLAFGYSLGSSERHRARDLMIYIAVGIGLVLVLVLATLWQSRH